MGNKITANALRRMLGDETAEKVIAGPQIGYWPNIKDPSSFNEKILHRKLYTDNKKFSQLEDKYRVRTYVSNKVGEEYLPELYHVTGNASEIPFNDLPEKFAVKASHGSGWNIIVENKEKTNLDNIKKKCSQWLEQEYAAHRSEYWYDKIEPRILIEEYINSGKSSLKDYKFFVFHGNVKLIQVDYNRFSDNHTRRFYNPDWEPKKFELYHSIGPITDPPPNLNKMLSIAEELGKGFNFIRVDLYNPFSDEVYFGEITVGHGSGTERFRPIKWDYKMGGYW
jgi:hypothetical protein